MATKHGVPSMTIAPAHLLTYVKAAHLVGVIITQLILTPSLVLSCFNSLFGALVRHASVFVSRVSIVLL